MNFLPYFFKKNIINIPVLMKIKEDNNRDLLLLHEDLIKMVGHDVNDEIIREVAVKRLLECYNTREIVDILKFYQQVK
ncbi:hypothetical protein PXD04_10120 [Methanosphaera sp. ISO3-F5]|uniref:hypothetical protein n=1 Tax=Methanosphaera sp. ISO3-F5 TaxID=1452353 RepID=UPI002B258923|nr:hypothetical protein [Methanosphaera sp. ISO3-F5]WQH64045.1 hypothetical protein PXD04_10120 [Methanosphaera sp. ISO3-F5]